MRRTIERAAAVSGVVAVSGAVAVVLGWSLLVLVGLAAVATPMVAIGLFGLPDGYLDVVVGTVVVGAGLIGLGASLLVLARRPWRVAPASGSGEAVR